MTLDEYISFQEKLGQQVVWIDDVPFSAYRPFFYWSLPRVASYDVAHNAAQRLLYSKALAILFPNKEGKHSINLIACQGPDYDLTKLHRKKRNQTRRGLERSKIKALDWDQMRREGLAINIEALKRQQRKSGRLDDPAWWDRQCRVSDEFSDVLAWGVFVKGELTGYVHIIIFDDPSENPTNKRLASVAHFMSNSRHLKCYPNEALIYRVTRILLEQYQCHRVILGGSSNDPHLLSWKRHMGYVEMPVQCTIIANPILHLAKYVMPKLKVYLDR